MAGMSEITQNPAGNLPPKPDNPADDPYAWLDRPAPWHSPPTGQPPPVENEEEAPRRVPIRTQRENTARPRHISDRRVSPVGETTLPSSRIRFWQTIRTLGLTFLAALLIATIFSYWTPEDEFLSERFLADMQMVYTTRVPAATFIATPIPTEPPIPRIGIIAGHSGPPQDPSFIVDPGAVCDDNNDNVPELTELEINTDVAQKVVTYLRTQGYQVDLLEEFDPRLTQYRADMLLSIHTNDCRNYGFGATGYNVAGAAARRGQAIDERLVNCVIEEYGKVTGLPRHFGVTEDMTSYHNFREVSVDTPVAIIEIAFMFADRQMVTFQRDLIAQGIIAGVLCFMQPATIPAPT